MNTIMDWIVWLQQHSVAAVTAVFTVLLVTTFWPGRRDSIERHGRIPFDEDR